VANNISLETVGSELLVGTYSQNLDDKGRILIPKKYRGVFDAGVYVTRGNKNILAVYPLEIFQNQYQKMNELDESEDDQVFRKRLFFSGDVTQLDKVGRFLIAPQLREYADLSETSEVTLIGVGNRLEIWEPNNWREYSREGYV
jgi:MraZ protein